MDQVLKCCCLWQQKKPVYSRDVSRGQGGDDDCLEGKTRSCQGVEPDVRLHLLLYPPHQDVHAAVHPDRLWELPQESCLQESGFPCIWVVLALSWPVMTSADATALLNLSRLVCIRDAAGVWDVEAFAGFRIPIPVGGIVGVLHSVPDFVAVADVAVGAATAPGKNVLQQKLST